MESKTIKSAPQSFRDFIKSWFLAIRPKTLSISLVPIIVGSVLSFSVVDHLNFYLIGLVLIASLFLQIGTNLINDAYDFIKGADTDERLGPARMTQKGLLTYNQVFVAGSFCFVMALFFTIPIIYVGGWPLLIVIICSIAAGFFYTAGPYPLAYLGISDFFILIFFGWVSTGSVYFLQTQSLDIQPFIAGTQIGLLAIIPHAINNLRDIETDKKANKRTLAVRFGVSFAKKQIIIMAILPFIIGLYWLYIGSYGAFFLPLIACLPMTSILFQIVRTDPSANYNQLLAQSARCQLIFGCLFAIGYLV